jgi:1-acyl-sn-glycerol-3-phosphate acyltransferase
MPADTPILAADPRDRKTYYTSMTPLRRVLTPLATGLFRLFADWMVTGLDNLPGQGPVVLAANHVTNYDVFFMQFGLPRPIFYMGKAELFDQPLLDPILRQLGGFPVRRGAQDEWAIRQARRVLENEQVLGIFPEGKRNHGRGLHPGKTGAARLAIATGSLIVPMAVIGTHRMFKRPLRRVKVRLELGLPLIPETYESTLALTDRVMFAIAALLPADQRGVYTEHPQGF